MSTQNPEVNSRPFFLAVPESVARHPKLTPAAKCVAGSIYTRTHQRNVHPGVYVLIRADWIAAEWAMSEDAVTSGIKQLIAAGIVERHRTRAGNCLRWTSYENPENQDSGNYGVRIPGKAESGGRESGKSGMMSRDSGNYGVTSRKKRNQDSGNSGVENPEKAECFLRPVLRPELRPEPSGARTDAGTHAREPEPADQGATIEPFESGLAVRLPEPERKPELPAAVRYLADRISPAAGQWAWSKVAIDGIDPNDWRLVETLRKVHAGGKRPNGTRYFDPIFQELPPERPKRPEEFSPEEREKIIAGMIARSNQRQATEASATMSAPLSGLLR